MINKNDILRRQYGYAIMEISKRVLMLMGNEPVAPGLTWKSALPEDERELVQIVKDEIALGLMSNKTASAELGQDYDDEQANMDEEQLTAAVNDEGAGVGVSGKCKSIYHRKKEEIERLHVRGTTRHFWDNFELVATRVDQD